MMKTFAIVMALGLLGCAASTKTVEPTKTTAVAPKELNQLSIEQVSTRIQSSAYVYDANSKESYEKGHVPTAQWVPDGVVTAAILPEDKSKELIFYCGGPKCMASHEAANQAVSLGWSNVAVMPDGISGWVSAGKPTEAKK
jgi:rhodanese-related sulfurtransferase